MNEALKEARRARAAGEVPVGALIVSEQKIIARAHNQTELLRDCTAHAEMLCITSALQHLGSKYLEDCTLYVTLEPCVMCAGAIYWSRVSKLVFAAEDPKRGFMRYGKSLLHPKTKLEFGVLENECSAILSNFFRLKRGY